MAEAQTFERTTPYLRENQVATLNNEARRQREMLEAPPFIANAVDKNLARQTLTRITRQLEENSPKPYGEGERDKAAAREKELREAWTAGMPTAAEMRKAPPGALEKHMAWERRNARNIDEWKNIRLRMHAAGMLPSEYEGSAVANIELYRPVGGPGEMSMDNALIPGKSFSLGKVNSSVLTDRDIAILNIIQPGILDRLALLTADQRREVKSAVDVLADETEKQPWEVDHLGLADLRKRCKAAGLKGNGTTADLKQRLKDFYGVETPKTEAPKTEN